MLIRSLFIAGFLFAWSAGGLGQDVPKVEVFGGYSRASSDLNGASGSITGNVNSWFGVTADVSGHTGSEQVSGIRLHKSSYTVQAGPRFSWRGDRLTPFAHALFGANKFKQSATIDDTYIEESATGFITTVGGGLDVKVSRRVAVRVFQIEYVRQNFFGIYENRARASAGIVFRLGTKD